MRFSMPYTGPDGSNLGGKMTKYGQSCNFFKLRVTKNSGMFFPGNKSPCGSALVRRKLLETYPNQMNSFKRDFKKRHFPKKWIPDGIYQSNSIFYRKLKWSVWSIWIYFKGYLSKFQWKKLSFWQKLIFWKMTMSKILGMCIFWGKRRLRHAPQTENRF